MKRDWDLLRYFLIEVEEEKDVFADFPDKPEWMEQTDEEYCQQYGGYEAFESRFFGHLELLVAHYRRFRTDPAPQRLRCSGFHQATQR